MKPGGHRDRPAIPGEELASRGDPVRRQYLHIAQMLS